MGDTAFIAESNRFIREAEIRSCSGGRYLLNNCILLPIEAESQDMDEVLKDADVIHHCMNDLSKPIKEKEQERFDKLCAEFEM